MESVFYKFMVSVLYAVQLHLMTTLTEFSSSFSSFLLLDVSFSVSTIKVGQLLHKMEVCKAWNTKLAQRGEPAEVQFLENQVPIIMFIAASIVELPICWCSKQPTHREGILMRHIFNISYIFRSVSDDLYILGLWVEGRPVSV
ncbi:hypothetical protein M5689_007529 [Euphorbia peplus]|nr:hypothetical protein M5689_007529 [Euphorbia peplus]